MLYTSADIPLLKLVMSSSTGDVSHITSGMVSLTPWVLQRPFLGENAWNSLGWPEIALDRQRETVIDRDRQRMSVEQTRRAFRA